MKAEEKRIAVIGIGGVGGYVAGMLAKAYPHVTMVARGARAESIREMVLCCTVIIKVRSLQDRNESLQSAIWDSRIIFLSV